MAPAAHPMMPSTYSRQRAVALLAVICIVQSTALATESLSPRRLEYRVAWNGIPAAGASVEITVDDFGGDPGCVVQATVSTNKVVDFFWKYRGMARTTFLAKEITPLQFTYESRVNGVLELAWIDFDMSNSQARSVYIKKERRQELEGAAIDFIDPITTTFRAMTGGAKVGQRLSYRVFTGKSHYEVTLTVLGKEEIDVPAGHFKALKIEPEIWKLGRRRRPERRLRAATLWVSSDLSRMLLRIRSSVFIGAVTLDLVSVTGEPGTAGANIPPTEAEPSGEEGAGLEPASPSSPTDG